jgi:hypothetical protein
MRCSVQAKDKCIDTIDFFVFNHVSSSDMASVIAGSGVHEKSPLVRVRGWDCQNGHPN